MKKITILFFCLSVIISCKNDHKTEQTVETISSESLENIIEKNDGLQLLEGEFVYYDGAAVLQTTSEIYGVLITNKTEELNKLAETYKTEPTDMVLVQIKGKITNKKDEKILWENKVEILEIISVSKLPSTDKNVLKLGNNN